MFARSARVRPCSARVAFSSFLRDTTSVPSSRFTATFGWNVSVSSPFGPFMRTVLPSILTSTPCGTFTGSLPIRLISALPYLLPDMLNPDAARRDSSRLMDSFVAAKPLLTRSPNIREDFPAQSLALGLAAGHHTGRGRDDGDAEATKDPRHLGLPCVYAQAWLADSTQARHR